MKKISFILLACFLFAGTVKAQNKTPASVHQFADLTFGIGDGQFTTAVGFVNNWQVGKKKKFELGVGLRLTNYFANNQYFKTAPAKLTSGKAGPGVFFADDIPENIDSVLFPKAQINALNISLNFGYQLTKKISAGFTIDAIGFSFGKKQNGTYYGNNFATGVPVSAKPTGFNALLISDNDRGSLNSEFFARYQLNNNWGVKLGFQFLFAEYTTDTKVQTTPGGDRNDRFRKKMSGVGIGVSYSLNNKK